MATMTAVEVKQELDDLLMEDTVDTDPWTLVRKRRAINRAVRSAWPHFKVPVEDSATVTLIANQYAYPLSSLSTIEDMGNGLGIVQVLLEPESTDPGSDWELLRTCMQARNGTLWTLYVPADIVDYYAGHKLKLRYYRRIAAFSTWTAAETIQSEFVNHVVYSACVDLFGLYAQGGSDFNVDQLVKLIPLYAQRAQDELKKNTVYMMPTMVGVRSEVDL